MELDPTNTNRPRGMFTSDDRKYLYNQKEYEHPQTESNAKARIRERAYHSLLDGGEFLARIPDDQRRRIFRMWEESDEDPDVTDAGDEDLLTPFSLREMGAKKANLERARKRFIESIAQLITTLYHDLNHANVADPKPLFEHAIEAAESSRGVYCDVDIQISEVVNTQQLLKRFEKGHKLKEAEIQHLREEEDLTGKEIVAYYDRRKERQEQLHDD